MNLGESDYEKLVLGQKELSKYFSLFAHFTRLSTLREVANAGGVGLDFMVDVNGLHADTVRTNLGLLKKHHFISGPLKSNQNLRYSINYSELDRFKKRFDEYYELINKNRFEKEQKKKLFMFVKVKHYLDDLKGDFDSISSERKEILKKIAHYITSKRQEGKPVNLVYICTHNSRRSHLGQVWAKAVADYFGIEAINTFSGGTEATAFNRNAINALLRAGFEIKQMSDSENPIYQVSHNDGEPSVCFSKVYDDSRNPQSEFAAVMTCSDAEENCPFIPGVELRVGTTYDDPKEFDNTPLQDQKYDERCKQIARETLYAFSLIN